MSDLVKNLRNWSSLHGGQYSSELTTQAADLIEQQQARIAELEAAVDRLREQLSAMAAQHQCGCGHPACNRCRDDADNRDALRVTPQQNLAERDAEVARKAVEEYKLSITEPNATVHRYPVVDLSGFYLNGANGKPTMMFGHIDNAESSSQPAFIKCVIGRLLELLEGFNAESSIVQKKNADKPSVIRASFIDGYTAGNGYPPSDWEVNQYLESVKE